MKAAKPELPAKRVTRARIPRTPPSIDTGSTAGQPPTRSCDPSKECDSRVLLWTYRYWNPEYKQRVTLDCPARSPHEALAKARRFLREQNSRFRRARVPWFVALPTRLTQLQLELPRP